MDDKTPAQRHTNMSHIRYKDTSIEVKFRKFLWKKGFRYRKNVKELPGKPDLVLPKYKSVIFINGCFWHKHNCPRFVWPSTNEEYWHNKIYGNIARDRKNQEILQEMGWNVIVVWECQLKKSIFEETMHRVINELMDNYLNSLETLQLENDGGAN